MRRISVVLGLVLAAFAAFAASPTAVQLTHLSSTEAGGKMTARQVVDMTIITCSAQEAASPKK